MVEERQMDMAPQMECQVRQRQWQMVVRICQQNVYGLLQVELLSRGVDNGVELQQETLFWSYQG